MKAKKYARDDLMMDTYREFAEFGRGSKNSSSVQQHSFPSSTFPDTFKDFFSMINEDEDNVELVSNLEDKVSECKI